MRTLLALAAVATMHVTPHTVSPGQQVRVHGLLGACPTATLLSKGFRTKHEFAGVPSTLATVRHGHYSRRVHVVSTPGTYTISGRCGGGNIGATAKFTVK